MRFLRLVIGVVVLIQGIQADEWMLVVLGGLFSLMPFFNLSMCGVGNCEVPQRRSTGSKLEDVTYEEVK